jgi:dTDP-4-amino-4,6-dideoxygalactose transaminase
MPNTIKKNINFFKQEKNNYILNNIYKKFNSDSWINGKIIKKVEQKIKENLKTSFYPSSCNSGTDALKLALLLDKDPKKDIYLTTPFSYIASSSVIKFLGLNVIYVDTNKCNFLLDLDKLENLLKKLPRNIKIRIKGIIFVELFGYTTNLRRLRKIADKNNLSLIGDCAQSFGSKYLNLSTVNYYDYSAISFYPTKIISAYGDAGLLIIKDKKKYKRSLLLKNNGHSIKDKSDCKLIGFNSRMDSIQAYIIGENLKVIRQIIKRKKNIFNYYNNTLKNFVKLPIFEKNIIQNNYIYSFYLKKNLRSKFINHMKKNGIQCQVFYKKLLSENKVLKPIFNTTIKNAIISKQNLVAIPSNQYLTNAEVKKISKTVIDFTIKY